MCCVHLIAFQWKWILKMLEEERYFAWKLLEKRRAKGGYSLSLRLNTMGFRLNVSIQLLPSFTADNRPGISFKYIFFAVVIFGIIGFFSAERPNRILWILPGFTFGLTLSVMFKRTYRQNLLMIINESSNKFTLLFTLDKKQRQNCIDFFTNFIKEKFDA